MKIKLYSSKGMMSDDVTLGGFTMLGYLSLSRHPEGDTEAATKRYVDDFTSVFNTSVITGGPLRKDQIINGMSGDVVPFNNTDLLLSHTTVQSGIFNQVTVNAKGRIINASNASGSGTNGIAFSEILNKPTTTAGYLANNSLYVLRTNGDASDVTIPGNLSTTLTPTVANHAVPMGFLNTLVGSLSANATVGQLKISTSSLIGSGWLQTNGGLLDKTLYSILYSVIGDTFNDVTTPTSQFKLPDYSSKSKGSLQYYIRAVP